MLSQISSEAICQTPLVGTHAYVCVSVLSHTSYYHPATILSSPPQLKILYETLEGISVRYN